MTKATLAQGFLLWIILTVIVIGAIIYLMIVFWYITIPIILIIWYLKKQGKINFQILKNLFQSRKHQENTKYQKRLETLEEHYRNLEEKLSRRYQKYGERLAANYRRRLQSLEDEFRKYKEYRERLEREFYEKMYGNYQRWYDDFTNEQNQTHEEYEKEYQAYDEYYHSNRTEEQNYQEYPNYYKILQLPFDASFDQLKSQYRKLALQYHPDKNKLKDTTKEFIDLTEAYETLSDPAKRAFYDENIYTNFKKDFS